MVNAQEQLSVLVHLSQADHKVVSSEIELIGYLGRMRGLNSGEIRELLDAPPEIPSFEHISDSRKFEYLLEMVQLMKIDGKISQSEIKFCKKIAGQLGYQAIVVRELSCYVYSDPGVVTDRNFLEQLANKYRKN